MINVILYAMKLTIRFISRQGPRRVENWGGGHIHIFMFTERKKQLISKGINNAEHEYMNIAPHPQLSIFRGPCFQSIYP